MTRHIVDRENLQVSSDSATHDSPAYLYVHFYIFGYSFTMYLYAPSFNLTNLRNGK